MRQVKGNLINGYFNREGPFIMVFKQSGHTENEALVERLENMSLQYKPPHFLLVDFEESKEFRERIKVTDPMTVLLTSMANVVRRMIDPQEPELKRVCEKYKPT